jgi:5-methylcytosine-specific restriction endonuclease McrA
MTPEERREYQRAWRAANPDKVRAYNAKALEQQKQRYAEDEAHRERVKARATEWNRENVERRSEIRRAYESKPENKQRRAAYSKQWNADNRELVAAYSLLHNSRRRGANAPDADARKYAVLLYRDPCAYCGTRERVEVDHIVPVSAGGTNTADNLTAACRSCNVRKRDKSLLTFLRQEAR